MSARTKRKKQRAEKAFGAIAENRHLKEKVTALEARLADERAQHEQQLADERAVCLERLNENAKLRCCVEELEKDNGNLVTLYNQLNDDLEEARDEIDRLRLVEKELADLQAQDRDVRKLRSRLKKRTEERDELRKKLNRLEQRLVRDYQERPFSG